jgi:hypothetical protein
MLKILITDQNRKFNLNMQILEEDNQLVLGDKELLLMGKKIDGVIIIIIIIII